MIAVMVAVQAEIIRARARSLTHRTGEDDLETRLELVSHADRVASR